MSQLVKVLELDSLTLESVRIVFDVSGLENFNIGPGTDDYTTLFRVDHSLNDNNKLVGIFTDGDLRRAIDRGIDIHQAKIDDVMTANCRSIKPGILAAEALRIMEDNKITEIPNNL